VVYLLKKGGKKKKKKKEACTSLCQAERQLKYNVVNNKKGADGLCNGPIFKCYILAF